MLSTLSHHTDAPDGDHFDLFLEIHNSPLLETYSALPDILADFLAGLPVCFSRKEPHRLIYLNYEGAISNQRGSVTIVWKGQHSLTCEPFPQLLWLVRDGDFLRLAFSDSISASPDYFPKLS